MKTCTVDGAPVAYTDVGQGPVLLFVHGVYVTGALWDDLTARLTIGSGALPRPGRWALKTS